MIKMLSNNILSSGLFVRNMKMIYLYEVSNFFTTSLEDLTIATKSTILEILDVYLKEFEIFEVDINYIQTEKTGMSYF